jgi:outer membrane protein assembly factor BamE (lipoprotein component of BamABCDE complex)
MRAAVLTLAIGASGCYSVGDHRITDERIVTQIEAGRGTMTKAEVMGLLGRPNILLPMGFAGAGAVPGEVPEQWMYHYTYAAARPTAFIPYAGIFMGGTDVTMHSLTLQFDGNGKLQWVGKSQTRGGGGGLQDTGNMPIQNPPPGQADKPSAEPARLASPGLKAGMPFKPAAEPPH